MVYPKKYSHKIHVQHILLVMYAMQRLPTTVLAEHLIPIFVALLIQITVQEEEMLKIYVMLITQITAQEKVAMWIIVRE